MRLAGDLGLPAERYQGNWIPHALRPATEDGVFFAGDSAGHCLPLTAEGIRTAFYFGIACGRELRAVLEGRRSRADALARYHAFSAAHRWKYECHAAGPARDPAAAARARSPRSRGRSRARGPSHWAFGHYLRIAPPAAALPAPPRPRAVPDAPAAALAAVMHAAGSSEHCASRGSAMLRPVTTTTSGPAPRSSRPASAAATATAPAPSATIPCARARKRIASAISASETCATAATWSRTSGNVTAPGSRLPASPSASVSPTVDRRDRARGQRARERRRALGLDGDDARAGRAPPPRGRGPEARLPPPSGQAIVERPGDLLVELAPERRLPRDHARVVVGGDVRRAAGARARARAAPPRRSPRRAWTSVTGSASQRGHLGRRGASPATTIVASHAERGRRPRDAEARVPADAVTTRPAAARAQRRERAAHLERAGGLERLELEQHVARRAPGRGRAAWARSRARDDGAAAAGVEVRGRRIGATLRDAPLTSSAGAQRGADLGHRPARELRPRQPAEEAVRGPVVAAQRHRHAGRLERPRVGLALVAQHVVGAP